MAVPGAGVPCESASRKADGDNDATLGPCNGRGGERERDVHAVAGRPRSALALGEITSTSTAPDQRRDLEEHTE